MADLEELAALLAFGSPQRQAIAAEDPYLNFQKSAVDPIMDLVIKSSVNPDYSTSEKIGAGLLTGLTSGIFGGLSQDYQSRAADAYQEALTGFRKGENPARPSVLSPSIFGLAKDQANIFALKKLDQQRAETLETKKALIDGLMKTENPKAQARILELGKQLGAFPKELQIASGEVAPIARPAKSITDLGPDFGVPTLRETEHEYFLENLEKGMPEIQASTSARAAADDFRSRAKSLFGKSLEAEAESITTAEDIIRKGKEGIATAGDTGSKIASTYEKALSYFPDLFPEAAKQAAGDQNLTLTQNLGAMLNRIKGTGALSDFETKALFETAMSPTKTRPQNETILRGYENGLQSMKEHQSFMNYFMQKTGGNPEFAQSMWDIYKSQNPIIVQNKEGQMVLNENRTPWQKFDFKTGYEQFIQGNSSPTLTGAEGATAPTLGTQGNVTADGRFKIDHINKKLIPIR